MNLKDFKYREETIDVKELFPKFDQELLKQEFNYSLDSNPHQSVLNITLDMWNGGYAWVLDNFGFHDTQYPDFSGHCHQITPILAVVLQTLGFKTAYLEAYRIDPFSGRMISPEEEQSDMKEEFCDIGRIPYCCLEVEIEGEKFYLSGKHLKRIDGQPKALLTPICYREMIGVFAHLDDPSKSGIYLEPAQKQPFTWKKQSAKDESPEYFQTFAYMKIRL